MRVSIERLRTLLLAAVATDPQSGSDAAAIAWAAVDQLSPNERVRAARCYAALIGEARLPVRVN